MTQTGFFVVDNIRRNVTCAKKQFAIHSYFKDVSFTDEVGVERDKTRVVCKACLMVYPHLTTTTSLSSGIDLKPDESNPRIQMQHKPWSKVPTQHGPMVSRSKASCQTLARADYLFSVARHSAVDGTCGYIRTRSAYTYRDAAGGHGGRVNGGNQRLCRAPPCDTLRVNIDLTLEKPGCDQSQVVQEMLELI